MKFLLIVFILFAVSNCTGDNNYLGNDVRLFENTPVWDIANAIEKDDTLKLKQLIASLPPKAIDYQEKKFGKSLLMWSIYSNHYHGFKVLLDAGADINIKANDSTQAINWAADVYETSDYLKELLEHKANVNYVANYPSSVRIRTPLIAAAWSSLESTKILVEAGANVNYSYSEGEKNNSPLYSAFRGGKIDVIHYLLIEAKADPTMRLETRLNGEDVYAVNLLRKLTFAIGSREHIKKMEIVDFLMKQGIDYWKTPVPKHYYELYDKEYLEMY